MSDFTTSPVQFKQIIPKPLQVQAMLNALVNTCQKTGKEMLKDFEATTKTWEGGKPVFRAKVIVEPENAPAMGRFPNRVMAEIAPVDDKSKGAMKWAYLNYGTSVRHAVMSKDFKPKTTVGLLSSKKGKGKMIFVSKKINLPGIKPRKWNAALKKKWSDEFTRRLRSAMLLMAEVSMHGTSGRSVSAWYK